LIGQETGSDMARAKGQKMDGKYSDRDRWTGEAVAKRLWALVALMVIACCGGTACRVEAAEVRGDDAAGEVEFFESKIRPLLVGRCYACHAAETKPSGGLRVDDRNGLLVGGDSGAAVVPADIGKSHLIERVTSSDPDKRMPPEGEPLSESEVADLKRWIERGVVWPAAEVQVAVEGEDPREIYESIKRDHWAWQPLSDPSVPSPQDNEWAVSDIDRFILAALEGRGLKPVGDADRATLLRRVSFDLTGLPPAEGEIEAFLADDSDRAYEAVVDRLLASPAFGERWGRHWLDVARYGESTGPSRNIPYPHAWRYRDYVIDSVNDDLPIDRFIREQVAGDLIAGQEANLSDAQRDRLLVATGYLAIGVKDVNQRFKTRFEMDNVDEQIDVLTRGVLGLTVSCARCHAHKFDAIPQEDYYALAGIFTSTVNGAGVRNKMGGGGLDYYDPQSLVTLSARGEPASPEALEAAAAKVAAAQAAWDKIRGTPEGLALAANGQRVQRKYRTELDEAKAEHDALKVAGLTMAHALRDAPQVADTALRLRGEAEQLGPVIPRGFPSLLHVPGSRLIPADRSGRLELAEWLTSPENPLFVRVAANQIWQKLFGEGIVSTPDNFGTSGASPSHPELLDHLAKRLISVGFSRKRLIRELVLSRAYRLSGEVNRQHLDVDPGNLLVWRHSPRRLSADEIRDAALMVSGELEHGRVEASPAARLPMVEMGDNGAEAKRVHQAADTSRARSIYLPLLRGVTPRALAAFDPAEQSLVTVKREATNVPGQSLFLLNSEFVNNLSDDAAGRFGVTSMSEEREAIRRSYFRLLGRDATPSEIDQAQSFLHLVAESANPSEPADGGAEEVTDQADRTADGLNIRSAWSMLHQAFVASAEFRYLR
jgi:cytochrome c553